MAWDLHLHIMCITFYQEIKNQITSMNISYCVFQDLILMCTLLDTADTCISFADETTNGFCKFLYGKMFSCNYHIQTLTHADEFACGDLVCPFFQNFCCNDYKEIAFVHE